MQPSGDVRALGDHGNQAGNANRREAGTAARRFGYLIAIAVNAAMIYAFHSVLEWGVPFVTESFTDILWAFDLSMGAQVAANALYLSYDPRWLRRLVSIVLNSLSFLATYTLWRVFPLDFGAAVWNDLARYALLFALVGIVIAIVVESIQLAVSRDDK